MSEPSPYPPLFARVYKGNDERTWDEKRKPHPDAFWTDKYGWCDEVERCEHGKIDPHGGCQCRIHHQWPGRSWFHEGAKGYIAWGTGEHEPDRFIPCTHKPPCPGAGIEGDDDGSSPSDSIHRISDRIGGDDEGLPGRPSVSAQSDPPYCSDCGEEHEGDCID